MDISSRFLPCLALKDGVDSDKPLTLLIIPEKKAIACNDMVETMKNSSIFATQQGWVLVHDGMSTFLLNPLNSEHRVQLPQLPKTLPRFSTCLLSGKPSHPKCSVLLVEPVAPVFWVSTAAWSDGRVPTAAWSGGSAHHRAAHAPTAKRFGGRRVPPGEKLPIYPIACCGGKFYFNGTADELGVLEFCPAPVFSKIKISGVIDGFFGYMNCSHVYLVESDNELYMACTLFGFDLKTIYEVRVYKMDFSQQRWSRVEELGDRTFLVSPYYFGASYSAEKHGLEPNCVYLACPGEKCYKIYNIKDGTSKVENVDEAPVSDRALWILPTEQP
uniref:KIB1-4 beta-propeller domain-containing protein n=1 Tax=Leersia perrieri TaxID=77586 RepID=A0A0D9VIY9_9ORYZ